MNCVQPGDPDYEADRRIANARFDYFPRLICYCSDAGDVAAALKRAADQRLAVRVRSGGHQHEGMCSGDGVLVIDLSQINGIAVSPDRTSAWIGAGAKLGDVYPQLLAENCIVPGGGCDDVRVGGLVQGGGWGLYARALGLTCDHLLGVRMVLANGQAIEAGIGTPEYGDLLWAVRGAGGGNFGVVTQFHLSLAAVAVPIWQFTLTWTDPALRHPVMEEWRANFPNHPDRGLTSFCRVSAARGVDPPMIVAGNFLGDEAQLGALLRRLLPGTFARALFPPPQKLHDAPGAGTHRMSHPDYQPGPPQSWLVAAGKAGQPPSATCNGGFYPHKVSSCFPTPSFSAEASRAITTFLDGQPEEPRARRYLSLHGLGGAVADPENRQGSCFPFREKPFMLQYQAWWGDPADKAVQAGCLAWIRGFRLSMEHSGFTEGSFINFPDKDLVPPSEGRRTLLGRYYAGNLEQLIRVKRKYDPSNVFDFDMGIPTQ